MRRSAEKQEKTENRGEKSMGINTRELEKLVDDFLESPEGDAFFSVQELSEKLQHASGAGSKESCEQTERACELLLGTHEELFLLDGMVYPKKTFFRGMTIKIVPSARELERNILFPGARFAPFCSPDIFPDDYLLRWKNADSAVQDIRAVQVKAPFHDFAAPSLMLGRSGLLDILVAENDENYHILQNTPRIEDAVLELTAYDMTEFYRAHKFQQGDAIYAIVEDWTNCSFTLAYCAYPDLPGREKQEQWLQDFESALLKVCVSESDYWEIPDQISHAYLHAYRSHADLRTKPYLAIEEYQNRMREIAIRRNSAEWLLVSADDAEGPGEFDFARPAGGETCSCGHDHEGHDENHDHAHDSPDDANGIRPEHFSISKGSLDSLDAILEDVRAPVNEIELFAMIQDAMANGEEDFESFRSRIRDLLDIHFADEAQETAFVNFLEEAWETSMDIFNPSIDAEKEPLRVRLLDLTRSRIDTAVSLLDSFKGKVPEDLAGSLRHIHRDIVETLALLNADSALPEDAAQQLAFRVEDLEDAWDDFQERAARRMSPAASRDGADS